MKAKEKAKELVDRFNRINEATGSFITEFQAKQCALMCVDEIINSNPTIVIEEIIEHHGYKETIESDIEYWQEVEQEIYKL